MTKFSLLFVIIPCIICCFFVSVTNTIKNDNTYIPDQSLYDQRILYEKKSWARLDPFLIYVHLIVGEVPEITNATANDTTWFADKDHQAGIFFPRVDQFTQMQITVANKTNPDNVTLLFRDDSSVYVWVNVSGGFVLPPRYYKYFAAGPDYFSGPLVVVVTFDQGVITFVEWDDDKCADCDAEKCIGANKTESNCGYNYNKVKCGETFSTNVGNSTTPEGKDLETDEDMCNIRIFVAFRGTDSKGFAMRTYAYVPSKFASFSTLNVYQTAAGVASDNYFPDDRYN